MIYIDNTQLIATIKELQLRKNYTQKQLAMAMGISPANLSNILKTKSHWRLMMSIKFVMV